jgi:hypothetical protein
MRYFGLYFGFFCFAFSYLFKGNIAAASEFGADMLFSYFVFTTAVSLSLVFILFLALKKGLNFAHISPFFGGLFKGAAGIFFMNLIANRVALLTGAYTLSIASKTDDAYSVAIGVSFLIFGYIVFRPFNFDFMSGFAKKREFAQPQDNNMHTTTTIDVEVVEEYEKLDKK